VRGGEVRNNERKKGKGETCVKKMRWRNSKMKFGKIIAGWVAGMPSENIQPTIPDSQGQVSSNKLNYRVGLLL